MAYSKNTWAKGDVVTSAKLNNIESGISTAEAVVMSVNETFAAPIYQVVEAAKAAAQSATTKTAAMVVSGGMADNVRYVANVTSGGQLVIVDIYGIENVAPPRSLIVTHSDTKGFTVGWTEIPGDGNIYDISLSIFTTVIVVRVSLVPETTVD